MVGQKSLYYTGPHSRERSRERLALCMASCRERNQDANFFAIAAAAFGAVVNSENCASAKVGDYVLPCAILHCQNPKLGEDGL